MQNKLFDQAQRILALTVVAVLFALCAPAKAESKNSLKPSRASLAVLETTDLHTQVIGYDYFRLVEDPSFGLDRTATLIKQARAEFDNTLLVDAGDTIEGTALADYQAQVKAPDCKTPIAIIKAMNALKYDAATIGNHEFNYGLDWLARASGRRLAVKDGIEKSPTPSCAGPQFSLVLANVLSKKSKRPLFPPYVILNRNIKAIDADGQPVIRKLRIGLIGFTPPQIMVWDKRWLNGKLTTTGMLEAAQSYVPLMKKAGADLIFVISHGGLDATPYQVNMENANYHLVRDIPGIDGLLMGHSHQVFPDASSKNPGFNASGVDKIKGTVHGIPAVMAGHWGKNLGVIAMALTHDGKHWRVDKNATRVQSRSTKLTDGKYVEADPAIRQLIAKEHEETIAYVRTPIGQSDFAMSSYFADVGDVSAIQPVNMAQADFIERDIKKSHPSLVNLPVLSVSAPFKSGFSGPADFTDVPTGPIAINNAADLYLYPNTIHAVKVTGVGLKAWLESAAKRFNRIDTTKPEQQELVSNFPGYNFDMLTSRDVIYEIDVSEAVGQRIKKLSYKGKMVDDKAEFIVATNNYRASGGGGFAGLDGSNIVVASTQTNRDVVIEYVKRTKNLSRATHGSDRSWSFSTIKTEGPVVFHAPTGKLAVAIAAGLTNIIELKSDDELGKGTALYEVKLAP
jgi:2',3'-cyclic-nucleotide 2'-phosphodiesterase / 3'-nucleotidase